MTEIIGHKDPLAFRNKPVHISRSSGDMNIDIVERKQTFQEMMEERKPLGPDGLYNHLHEDGHLFANLGVGIILTLTHRGTDYLLLNRQEREQYGDIVTNIISGYIDQKHLENPVEAAEEEISEEFLPITANNEVMRIRRKNQIIGRPFPDYFEDSEFTFGLKHPAKYDIYHLKNPVYMDGSHIEGDPGLFFDAKHNTAKLVFSYHLETDADLEELAVSLHHSEDTFNPETKQLDVKFKPYDITLIELDRCGLLTDSARVMQDGRLYALHTNNMMMSEVFSINNRAITWKDKAPLHEVVENQKQIRESVICPYSEEFNPLV